MQSRKKHKKKGIKKMQKKIYFDMDGTLADFYSVENWLESLENESVHPYENAKPLFNFSSFARLLHAVQNKGYEIGIISWGSKTASEEYLAEIEQAKLKWLAKHLPSVEWDEIIITHYGTPKEELAEFSSGILFDDEKRNRDNWCGIAFDESAILNFLRIIAQSP